MEIEFLRLVPPDGPYALGRFKVTSEDQREQYVNVKFPNRAQTTFASALELELLSANQIADITEHWGRERITDLLGTQGNLPKELAIKVTLIDAQVCLKKWGLLS